MKPRTVPLVRALTDRPTPLVSVDLCDILPAVIANIIGDAAYHPRLRAKLIAELASGGVLRTEQRNCLAQELASEMQEFEHTKLEFTAEQVEVIIVMLNDALDDLRCH